MNAWMSFPNDSSSGWQFKEGSVNLDNFLMHRPADLPSHHA